MNTNKKRCMNYLTLDSPTMEGNRSLHIHKKDKTIVIILALEDKALLHKGSMTKNNIRHPQMDNPSRQLATKSNM